MQLHVCIFMVVIWCFAKLRLILYCHRSLIFFEGICLHGSSPSPSYPQWVRTPRRGAACSRRGGADGAGGRGEEEERGAGAGEIRGAAQGSQVSQTFWRSSPHWLFFLSQDISTWTEKRWRGQEKCFWITVIEWTAVRPRGKKRGPNNCHVSHSV